MIEEFVKKYYEKEEALKEVFTLAHPDDYASLVKSVVETVLNPDNTYDQPDATRIHEIDDGDYQGTLVYVIGAVGYQPNIYWSVKVYYGSCSGCDTLQGINDSFGNAPPTEEQVKDYMQLALHIIQEIKEL